MTMINMKKLGHTELRSVSGGYAISYGRWQRYKKAENLERLQELNANGGTRDSSLGQSVPIRSS